MNSKVCLNWIAKYWQAQNNDNNKYIYKKNKQTKKKIALKTYSGVRGQH